MKRTNVMTSRKKKKKNFREARAQFLVTQSLATLFASDVWGPVYVSTCGNALAFFLFFFFFLPIHNSLGSLSTFHHVEKTIVWH